MGQREAAPVPELAHMIQRAERGDRQAVRQLVAALEATPHLAMELLKQAGPLAYPVAVDASGAVADAYGAQDLAWLTLTGKHGHVRWSHDGWLDATRLETTLQSALLSTPAPHATAATGACPPDNPPSNLLGS